MSIAEQIKTGQHDDELKAIVREARRRQMAKAAEMIGSFTKGDKVQFINCVPQLLNGHQAKVVRPMKKNVVVKLTRKVNAHYPRGREITVPALMIKKIT